MMFFLLLMFKEPSFISSPWLSVAGFAYIDLKVLYGDKLLLSEENKAEHSISCIYTYEK